MKIYCTLLKNDLERYKMDMLNKNDETLSTDYINNQINNQEVIRDLKKRYFRKEQFWEAENN
jgi:hypothetical protein